MMVLVLSGPFWTLGLGDELLLQICHSFFWPTGRFPRFRKGRWQALNDIPKFYSKGFPMGP